MSGIDPIAADLAAMTAGLGKAQEAANAADNAAAQIAQRAAGSGFAGIAQNMSRVRDAMREAEARDDTAPEPPETEEETEDEGPAETGPTKPPSTDSSSTA